MIGSNIRKLRRGERLKRYLKRIFLNIMFDSKEAVTRKTWDHHRGCLRLARE